MTKNYDCPVCDDPEPNAVKNEYGVSDVHCLNCGSQWLYDHSYNRIFIQNVGDGYSHDHNFKPYRIRSDLIKFKCRCGERKRVKRKKIREKLAEQEEQNLEEAVNEQ